MELQAASCKLQAASCKPQAASRKLQAASCSIGQKQLQLDYLEKLIAVASEELGMDIKKNFGQQPSNGTDSTLSKTPGQ
jgi:transposase